MHPYITAQLACDRRRNLKSQTLRPSRLVQSLPLRKAREWRDACAS